MVIILAPCGVGLLITVLAVFVANRGAPELVEGDITRAIVGAVLGPLVLLVARAGMHRLLHPLTAEFDFLFYSLGPPMFGSFLGAATALLWPLKRVGLRAAARNMLLIVSLVVFPLGGWLLYDLLAHVLPSRQLATETWQSTLFWLSDPLLPVLWTGVLWLIWWRSFRTQRGSS